jgi:hypothetical protein
VVSECVFEASADDEGGGEVDEGEVELGSAFPAGGEAAVVVEPGVGAFDRPAVAAVGVAAAALAAAAAFRDVWFDAARLELVAEVVGVVAAVGVEPVGVFFVAAAQRRDRVDDGEQVSLLVLVRRGDTGGEREPVAVYGEVDLAARTAAVGRVFADSGAPLFAATIVASTKTADQPTRFPATSRCCSRSTSCGHTPARCHSSKRRQHVFPDGLPGLGGNSRHGIPHLSTVKIPSKHARSE